MPITTTPSERIGRYTRMRRFLVRFIRPESFVHNPSSEGFTITTSGFEFSVHTALPRRSGPTELSRCSRHRGGRRAPARSVNGDHVVLAFRLHAEATEIDEHDRPGPHPSNFPMDTIEISRLSRYSGAPYFFLSSTSHEAV